MKIAILADSNALPRGPSWGDLPLEATYPYLLDQIFKKKLGKHSPTIIERGKRYRTILNVLEDWSEIVELRQVDYAVVQVGGADCAPRVLLPEERRWLKDLPFSRMSRFLLRVEERYRRAILLRYPHRVCVKAAEFRAAAEELVSRAKRAGLRRLIFINIFDPAPQVLRDFAGADSKIREYNSILAAQTFHPWVSSIDLHAIVKQMGGAGELTVDGMHLNLRGQMRLAQSLHKVIWEDYLGPELSSREPYPYTTTGSLGNPLLHFEPRIALRAQTEIS